MNNSGTQQQREPCSCTLAFSQHLTVMILGIVGMIIGIVIVALNVYFANFWPLISGALAFASGLQGLLVYRNPGSSCFNCHGILAVINIVNLGVFGIACLFLVSAFWVIWAIAAFAMELWVTIATFCCKLGPRGAVAGSSVELPTAHPNGVQIAQGHPAGSEYGSHHEYPSSGSQSGLKQPYMP